MAGQSCLPFINDCPQPAGFTFTSQQLEKRNWLKKKEVTLLCKRDQRCQIRLKHDNFPCVISFKPTIPHCFRKNKLP